MANARHTIEGRLVGMALEVGGEVGVRQLAHPCGEGIALARLRRRAHRAHEKGAGDRGRAAHPLQLIP